jgi:hypothetical protein
MVQVVQRLLMMMSLFFKAAGVKIKMKYLFLPFSLLLSFNSFAMVNPSELLLKVYQIAIAVDDDCSNPIVLHSTPAGVEMNFLSNPDIGSAPLADGTYNCVMITMDDLIKFRPAATEGACTANQQYLHDLCRNQANSNNNVMMSHTDVLMGTTTTNTECAGTSSQGAGTVANKVTMYLRTTGLGFSDPQSMYVTSWMKGIAAIGSAGTETDNTSPYFGMGVPTVAVSNGGKLENPFVKNGRTVGVFYADGNGFVGEESGHCGLMGAKFGFRNP